MSAPTKRLPPPPTRAKYRKRIAALRESLEPWEGYTREVDGRQAPYPSVTKPEQAKLAREARQVADDLEKLLDQVEANILGRHG